MGGRQASPFRDDTDGDLVLAVVTLERGIASLQCAEGAAVATRAYLEGRLDLAYLEMRRRVRRD